MSRWWSISYLSENQHFELGTDYSMVTVKKGSVLDYTIEREEGRLVVRHENGGSVAVADSGEQGCSLDTLVLGNDSYSVRYITQPLLVGYKNDNALYVSASESGKDNIVLIDCKNKTLTTGKGEDTVYVFKSDEIAIKGDTGDDLITVFNGNNSTLIGGVGNDIYKILSPLKNNEIVTIEQRGAGEYDSDILVLSKIKKEDITYSLDGTNLVLTNKNNKSEIKINNYLEHGLDKIVFADGVLKESQICNILQELKGNEKTALDVIKSFMHSLDITAKSGMSALDEAVKFCSQGKYSTIGQLINEFKTVYTNNAGNSEEEHKAFLKQYCDIDLDNADTGAISGYDASGLKVKTASSVVKEQANVSVENFAYDPTKLAKAKVKTYNFTCSGGTINHGISDNKQEYYMYKSNGITYYWSEKDWARLGIDTNVARQIIGATITSWTGASFDLISESYGMSLQDKGSTLAKADDGSRMMYISLYNDNNSSNTALACASHRGNTTYECLAINAKYFPDKLTDINGNCGSGNWGGFFFDRTIAHEMTHSVMQANINSFGSLPSYIVEGLAELVHGIDDERQNAILNLLNNTGNLNSVFNTMQNIGENTYVGGYLLLRYLAKQAAEYLNSSNSISSYSVNSDILSLQYLDSVSRAELTFNKELSDTSRISCDYSEQNKGILVFEAKA